MSSRLARKKGRSKKGLNGDNGKTCSMCNDYIPKNLKQHERICQINMANRRAALQIRVKQHRNKEDGPSRVQELTPNVFGPTTRPLSPGPMQLDDDDDFQHTEDMDIDYEDPSTIPTVPLPPRFIYVVHHPHAQKFPEFIPLDAESNPMVDSMTWDGGDRPWSPFKTYADFKFAYRCVRRQMSNAQIDEDLKEMHEGVYSTDCFITFRNHRDLRNALAAARVGGVPFQRKTFTLDFNGPIYGKRYEIEVEFRDAWEIIKDWVADETLAPVSTWYPQRRYLCLDGKIDLSNPLIEEPWTGEDWWKAEDTLPADSAYPSCYLGLHVWLDKGLVSTKVKMHPILFRGCWIHSTTRNGSGNGGSMLAGFLCIPEELSHIDPHQLPHGERTEYDLLMRLIYRAGCEVLTEPLRRRSHRGEALEFGDHKIRTGYPGILIESMDFEEVAAWLAIRNSVALHPCPRCLVHKSDLHRLTSTGRWERRTTETMSRALSRAPNTSKTAREEYFREFGLHDFKHFLWEFANSDLYQGIGYDCLHYFDGGKWGRHVWPLLTQYLRSEKLATTFNNHMEQFPRWRNLKHIRGATAISYSEGQTFLDILKSALPCLVQILPANSCLVRLVRVMQKIRVMLGLDVTTQTRLQHLEELISDYEKICNEVTREHEKNFDFLKQHYLSHAIEIFRAKGTSRNMNTRAGEGYQQEVSDLYTRTNGKSAEHQIVIHDENEEALARLNMRVDAWKQSQSEDSDKLIDPVDNHSEIPPHWRLGSPDSRRVSPHRIETSFAGEKVFQKFNSRLREYLARHYSDLQIAPEAQIEILPCKALYVSYQSCVNWKSNTDILRCNGSFHGRPRFDSIIFEAADDAQAMGELQFLFRCFIPNKPTLDLAMIRTYKRTTWKPKTRTDCPVRVQDAEPMFIALEHVTRGLLTCPIFGASRQVFYVIDCIDEDMYLRLNGID